MSETISTGGWTATLIQAGTLPMDGTDLAPPGALPDTLSVPSNVLVLRGHGRTLLVDTASGSRAAEWEGAVEDLDGFERQAVCPGTDPVQEFLKMQIDRERPRLVNQAQPRVEGRDDH